MSKDQTPAGLQNPADTPGDGGANLQDVERLTQGMSNGQKRRAIQAGRFGPGPLAHIRTNDSYLEPGEKRASLS